VSLLKGRQVSIGSLPKNPESQATVRRQCQTDSDERRRYVRAVGRSGRQPCGHDAPIAGCAHYQCAFALYHSQSEIIPQLVESRLLWMERLNALVFLHLVRGKFGFSLLAMNSR
jgi:hypothetical protein